MKKNILLFLSLFIVCAVNSQISLRPQVGINVPSISSDDLSGSIGYQFGADLQIGNSFYFQPGLNFESNKISLKDVGDINVGKINIPVMIGIALFEKEDAAFGIRAFAGPNLAFHVNEDLDEVSGSDITGENFKSAVFSGQVGAGFDVSILFVDLVYQFGLSDFFEGSSQVEDSKNHRFIANAGIRIGF